MTEATLIPLGQGLYYAEALITFCGARLQTRMSVAQLKSGGLWVCSPLPFTPALAEALASLGEVEHVASPNKIHNQGLAAFHERYPAAKIWASPGLPERCPHLHFDGVLGNSAETAWSPELDQRLTDGNVFFSEAVFLHRASATLIVADLVENLGQATLPAATARAPGRGSRRSTPGPLSASSSHTASSSRKTRTRPFAP